MSENPSISFSQIIGFTFRGAKLETHPTTIIISIATWNLLSNYGNKTNAEIDSNMAQQLEIIT